MRIVQDLLSRELFRDKRCADRHSFCLEDIVRQGTCNENLVVTLEKERDERSFRLEFGAAQDGERRMLRRTRRVYMVDFVAQEKSREMRQDLRHADNRSMFTMVRSESV